MPNETSAQTILSPKTMAFQTHEDYFKSVPPKSRRLLKEIQTRVESLLPTATRCIGYSMPAFRHGRIFFYFAAFKNHIGIYPPVPKGTPLDRKLAPYRGKKGNLSFPLESPLPIDLIGRVAQLLFETHSKE